MMREGSPQNAKKNYSSRADISLAGLIVRLAYTHHTLPVCTKPIVVDRKYAKPYAVIYSSKFRY
jgi:hypothetical protein